MPAGMKNQKSGRPEKKSAVGRFSRTARERGFSFVEVIISIFIIVVGIVATITLLGKSMKESLDSRDQVIAGLLAQEGIELVRNIRDNNWANWATSAVSFDHITAGDNCRIDKNDNYPTDLICEYPNTEDLALKIDSNGMYSHTGTTATKFYRKLNIVDLILGEEKKVTSMVVWSGSSTPFFPVVTECNTAKKCAYTEIILTKWGE